MKKDELFWLQNAQEHLEILEGHLKSGSLDRQVVLDAACLRLASCIEELAGLTVTRREEYFGDKWHAMWSFRNRVAHAYFNIDVDIAKATITHDVPVLKLEIEEAIRTLSKPPSSESP